jgi:hypothetical protein
VLLCVLEKNEKFEKPLDLELTPRSKMTLNIGASEHLPNNPSADIALEGEKAIRFDSAGGNRLETSIDEIENWRSQLERGAAYDH